MIVAILVLAVLTILSVQASNRKVVSYLGKAGPSALRDALVFGVFAILCATAIVVLSIILLATGRG